MRGEEERESEFSRRLSSLLRHIKLELIQDVVGKKLRIIDKVFGKTFVTTIESAEYIPEGSLDVLRFAVAGVARDPRRPEDLPVIELRSESGKLAWKVFFGGYDDNLGQLEITVGQLGGLRH